MSAGTTGIGTDVWQDWLPRQRWFAGKGRATTVLSDAVVELERTPTTVVRVHLVGVGYDGSSQVSQTYQVPVVLHAERRNGSEASFVGVAEDADGSAWFAYDGPHDLAFMRALLGLVAQGSEATLPVDGSQGLQLKGVRQPGAALPDASAPSRVMDGEQSNTSVVIRSTPPLICKVFRVVAPGENPDVVVQAAIAAAGSTAVPATTGWVEGTWTTPEGPATGHLAFVQEFFPGTQDAWRVATEALAAGFDFSDRARALGARTASVHQVLAESMGARDMPAQGLRELADALLERLAWALDAAPALAAYEAAARTALESVASAGAAPRLQRIHGDYHLGQVLDVPERGWVLLDFEGEPLRPLAERSRPDLALRDVAGMLRSFDYAAGALVVGKPQSAPEAREWAQTCRDAFCEGYAEVAGRDPRQDVELLRALELDKALYEVVYESRNRPDWLAIPLTAVDRLLSPVPDEKQVTKVTPSDKPKRTPPTSAAKKTTKTAAAAKQAAAPQGGPAATAAPRPVATDELDRILAGAHGDPHGILGLHPHDGSLTLRTLRPNAREVVAILADGSRIQLEHEHEGVFVGVVPGTEVSDYRLDVTYDGPDGTPESRSTFPVDDPYRFLPTLGEVDLHLIGEGRHEQLWTVLGAHVRRYPGLMGDVVGTSFAVWAPHARGVRLVGDFNHWDGTAHPMRALGSSGVWELFVPDVGDGTRYKLEILGSDGGRRLKADPMARATEAPPSTASVVTESGYAWGDDAWLAKRAATDPHNGPMSTYEVHLGSWRAGLSYLEMAEQLVDYVVETGFTHVELMPVMEHPYGPSWGYQVSGYFAPTARFGTPDEFRYLVDRLHQAGIGVLLDWVPAHFPKDAFALARFDGQALYEHPDPRRGDQPDWGTHIFDLGRPQVKNFLVANAVYWCEEFHIDGLRVDAVASMLYLDYSRKDGEWLPNQYGGRENLEAVQLLQETNAVLYRRVPGVVTIAEESTAWPGVSRPTHLGGLGFGLKWNMGWMHDSLDYVAREPVYRQFHHHQMTFALMYAWSENFVLPISHDEVVHGKGSLLRKMPGDRWQQLATVRAYLALMWAHPGKQLLFMGSEFAQEAEWADSRGLDWWLLDQPAHRGVHTLVRDMNRIYRESTALWSQDLTPDGFRWIDANDAAGNVFSFLRFGDQGPDDVLACVVNFSGSPHHGYRIGLPSTGEWEEVLNTDADLYGGSGVGNLGSVVADDVAWHGMQASASISVPPLGAVWFRPAGARATQGQGSVEKG